MIDVLAFIGIYFWLTAVVVHYRIHVRLQCPWWRLPMVLVAPFVVSMAMLLDESMELPND